MNGNKIGTLISEMITYYKGDPRRISHFLKVYGFAKTIGEREGLDERTQETLEITAVVHDIGIRVSEGKYQSAAGKYQELEGPDEAEKLLKRLSCDQELIDRVSYLVGHHHTYHLIDGIDYQVLVEADFLVNIYEDNMTADSIKSVKEKIFKTETGAKILDEMYLSM